MKDDLQTKRVYRSENKVFSDEKKRINDFVCKDAAKKLPIITPNTTNIP